MNALDGTASGLLAPSFWRAQSASTTVGVASREVAEERHVALAYERCFRELCGYLALPDDWDGYGGQSPDVQAIHCALEALALIAAERLPAPRAMVSGNGEVGLYWRNGYHCEINFQSDRRFYYFCEKGSDVAAAGEDIELSSDLPDELSEFLLQVSYSMET
jgi:hypothetical protein